MDLFFQHINFFTGLLYRPLFEKGIEEGLYHRDDGFGGLVLLVCANASRFSSDPRVLLEGTDSWHSCGWKYFAQVQMVRKSLLSAPCLYDLQMYSVRGVLVSPLCPLIHCIVCWVSYLSYFCKAVLLPRRVGPWSASASV